MISNITQCRIERLVNRPAAPQGKPNVKYTDLPTRNIMKEFNSILAFLKGRSVDFTGLLTRNRWRELARLALGPARLVQDKLSRSNVRVIYIFILRLNSLMRRSNTTFFVVKYLKACYVLTQQAAGGYKIKSVQDLGCAVSRTRRGLPRLIPASHRLRIRNGESRILRLWLTLFSFYRVIEVPLSGFCINDDSYRTKYTSKKLATITNPSTILPLTGDIVAFIKRFFLEARTTFGKPFEVFASLKDQMIFASVRRPLLKVVPFPITRSSPGTTGLCISTHPEVLSLQAEAILRNKVLYRCFKGMTHLTGNLELMGMLESAGSLRHPRGLSVLYLGKLGFKAESAGKLRVFAIVDAWTQWLLKPLHDIIFNCLKVIPSDGTFDQDAVLRRLLLRARESNQKSIFSFDLSAATDRLPVVLQEKILSEVLGKEYASYWRLLLTERLYEVPDNDAVSNLGINPCTVKYEVGQPIGALTSWAMLALTHHFIVQYAAFQYLGNSYKWFDLYAVLGDDVVIANEGVATNYLEIMKTLGVEVGLSKSLVSKRSLTFEFAKRTFWRGMDVSPISFLEYSVAKINLAASLTLFAKASRTKRVAVYLSAIGGFGFRALGALDQAFVDLPKRQRNYLIAFESPFGVEKTDFDTWVRMFSRNRKLSFTPENVEECFKTLYGELVTIFNRLQKAREELTSRLPRLSQIIGKGFMPVPQGNPWDVPNRDRPWRSDVTPKNAPDKHGFEYISGGPWSRVPPLDRSVFRYEDKKGKERFIDPQYSTLTRFVFESTVLSAGNAILRVTDAINTIRSQVDPLKTLAEFVRELKELETDLSSFRRDFGSSWRPEMSESDLRAILVKPMKLRAKILRDTPGLPIRAPSRRTSARMAQLRRAKKGKQVT